jgi:hypothetical protein
MDRTAPISQDEAKMKEVFLTTLGLSQSKHWLQVSLIPVVQYLAVWLSADFYCDFDSTASTWLSV